MVGALALVDMVKAVDKHARITDVRVTAKSRWAVRRLGGGVTAAAARGRHRASNRAAAGVYPTAPAR